MVRKMKIIILLFILGFLGFPKISNSGDFNDFKNELNSFEYFETKKVNKLKEWKINQIKCDIIYYLKDIDTSKYMSYVKDEHILIMDSLRLKYRIPKYVYYRQILRESWFIEDIKSPVGAIGYSQIMYNTYLFFKEDLNLQDPTRLDVNENLLTGAYYMRYLKNKIDDKYGNDVSEKQKWIYTLSSYNAGYGKHIVSLYKFNETINYIKFIMKNTT